MYDRFMELLRKSGVRVSDVANATGIRNGVFSDWKSGRATPKADKLKLIAEYFDVTVDYLMGNDNSHRGVKIPVLGRVAAGVPILAQEDILDYEEITPEMAKRGDYFGLIVKGNSMEPRFFEGDIAIVRSQPDADSGDIVVAMVNGEEACMKRLIKYAHAIGLQSLNQAYPTRMFSETDIERLPVKIIGKVEQVRGNV